MLIYLLAFKTSYGATTISGRYQYDLYAGKAEAQYSVTNHFEAVVSPKGWIIRCQCAPSPANDGPESEIISSSDGINCYVIHIPNVAFNEKAWGKRYDEIKGDLPVAKAAIYKGDRPPGVEFMVQNIWRSLFWNPQSLPPSTKLPLPFLSGDDDPSAHCQVEWLTNGISPHDFKLLLKTDAGFSQMARVNGKDVRVKPAPPYNHGYTVAVGTWGQMNDFGGMLLPGKMTFDTFSPKFEGRTAEDLAKSYTYCLTVTNVTAVADPTIPFPLPKGKALIEDHRQAGARGQFTQRFSSTGWEQAATEPSGTPNESINLEVGKPVPDFAVKTFDGEDVTLKAHYGKYVLLIFWAPSCVPCVAEIPELKAIYNKYGSDGRFVQIGMDMDPGKNEGQRFVQERQMNWIQAFPGDPLRFSIEKSFGFSAVPQVLLIGPDGKLLAKDLRHGSVEAAVDSALGLRVNAAREP